MEWIFAAGAIGALLGLRFRVQVLVLASAAAVVLCLLFAPFAGLGLLHAAGMVVLVLIALQAGYLVGLLVSYACSRGGLSRSAYVQAIARAFNCGARAR